MNSREAEIGNDTAQTHSPNSNQSCSLSPARP
jgi:hypothetical protein